LKISPKVADTFFRRIHLGFENIKQNPNSFPKAHKDVRKYVVKKFPFVIYYRIVDSTIQVIAIFHTSRNPEI
jgi:plasmid stabilization system protein ParE